MKITVNMTNDEMATLTTTMDRIKGIFGDKPESAEYKNSIEKYPGVTITEKFTDEGFVGTMDIESKMLDITCKAGVKLFKQFHAIITAVGAFFGSIEDIWQNLKHEIRAEFRTETKYGFASIVEPRMNLCHSFKIRDNGYSKTVVEVTHHSDKGCFTIEALEALLWSQHDKDTFVCGIPEEDADKKYEEYRRSVSADWHGTMAE